MSGPLSRWAKVFDIGAVAQRAGNGDEGCRVDISRGAGGGGACVGAAAQATDGTIK